MDSIKVYYYARDTKGATVVTLTEAEYFETYECFDGYGESEHYEEIANVMHNCGATDFGEGFVYNHSVYQLPLGSTVESIVYAMREEGFELVDDPDFKKFCMETDIVYYRSKVEEGKTRIVVTSDVNNSIFMLSKLFLHAKHKALQAL